MVISNPRELEKLKDRIPNLINIIRVAIVFPLMIMHILGLETGSRANLHASWTAWAFYLWLAIACWMIFFSTLNPQWQWQALRIPSFSAVADITMIGVLTYLFGGIDSGFGILILPFVGSSCLLSYGRYPLLYASYASILLIFNALADSNINMYPLILDAKTVTNTFVVVAGSYFVAMIASLSVRYIDRAGKLAHENHVAYRRIRGLNQIVLNRVQEAVVVINVEHQTILFNKKAKDLLPMLEIGQHTSLFDPVAILWDKTSSHTFEHHIDTPELTARIRAVPMNKKQNKLLILYIRPQSEIQAEALSVKLAALGQLTANLATKSATRCPPSATPTAALYFWTKWPTCPFPCRSNSCARFKKKPCAVSATRPSSPSMSASSAPPTKTSKPLSKAAHSAKTCITVSMSSASICRPCVKCAKI